MATSDFLMRQIEGFTDMLSVLLFDRKSSGQVDTVYDTQTTVEGHTLLIDLRFLLTQGRINDAEDLLFERVESDSGADYREVARRFYDWLEEMSDQELVQSGFSREEIGEGREWVQKFYRG